MAKNQKKYTQEFKQQIVDLYNTVGMRRRDNELWLYARHEAC